MEIYSKPFLHAVITPPVEIYKYAESIFPEPPTLLPGLRTNNKIHDTDIQTYLNSVIDNVYEVFLPRLREEYPKMEFESLVTRKKYLFSHNTASTEPNVIRGLHLDHGSMIILGMWYFKEEGDDAGGDLYLMNPLTKETMTFKYDSNKLIIFPNLLTSWHAITKREATTISRKFINILLESDIPLHSYSRHGQNEPRKKVVNNFK